MGRLCFRVDDCLNTGF